MQFQDDVVGGVTLIRPAIQSPDFKTGEEGWEINADGSAEFNNVTIRNGTQVSGTQLYYDGTPGPNTLLMAIAPEQGTDPYGNTYQAGMNLYYNGVIQVIAGIGENSSGQGGVTSYLYDQPNNLWTYSALTAGLIELGIWDPVTKYPAYPARLQYTRFHNNGADGTGSTNNLTIHSGSDGVGEWEALVGLQSASNTTTNDSIVALTAGSYTFNDVDQGRGLVASVALTTNVEFTRTEAPLLWSDDITWEGGRVYRVDVDFAVQSDTASGFFLFQVRKNSLTGTPWVTQRRAESIPGSPTQVRYISMRFYLTPTADFTASLMFTGTANGSTIATLVADAAGAMATMNIVDVGAAPLPHDPFPPPSWAAIPIS